MAHFYGEVQGQSRTTATRIGSKGSGISVRAASWRMSAKVSIHEEEGEDVLHIAVYKGNTFCGSCKKVFDKQFSTDMILINEEENHERNI